MKTIAGLVLAALLAFAAPPSARAADGKIVVVAAENFYGDIARQIGGDRVTVVSIMNSPDQDPHLFETTPGIVKQIAGAQIAIVNGADYDPWMEKLLAAVAAAGAPHDQRGRAHAPQSGRQSTSVVRPCDHGRGRGACSTPTSPRRTAHMARTTMRGSPPSRLAQADQRQDRHLARQICRRHR